MSHEIYFPLDRVFSVEGTEWHGLAQPVESIGETQLAELSPDILECEQIQGLTSDGRAFSLPAHKVIVADYSTCRPDLITNAEYPGAIVPLHIPKLSYTPIPNRDLADAMLTALADVDATVSCAGTLDKGRKFFLSVRLNGNSELNVNGDKFLANLNFITSHDGTLAAQAYDSTIRIVCMNTLRWSLQAAGEVGFKVYHTINSDLQLANMGDLLNKILTGRAQFQVAMKALADKPLANHQQAREIVAGYYGETTGRDGTSASQERAKLSTRSINAIEEITRLTVMGMGNNGRNQYDLLNGFTEYYTSGDGTGKASNKSTTRISKMCKAAMGEPAEHKTQFCDLLMSARVLEVQEKGRELLAMS